MDSTPPSPELVMGPQHALGMVGNGSAIEGIYRWLTKAAALQSPVIIEGEPGVGKLLAARALHTLSSRGTATLTVLEASQLTPQSLLETLERESQSAAPGTVVLRRVEDLDLRVQPVLLRALKERTGARVPRLVATAFRSLQQLVREGAFREDLYFRLSVLPLVIPPLRDRKEDIPSLVRLSLGRDPQGRPRMVSAQAMERAIHYPWPGNVRELLQVFADAAERATGPEVGLELLPELLSRGAASAHVMAPLYPPSFFPQGLLPVLPNPLDKLRRPIVPMLGPPPGFKLDLPSFPGSGAPSGVAGVASGAAGASATGDTGLPVSEHLSFKEAKSQLLVAFEREYLARLLKRCGGSITKTAQQSGLHRKSIERLVKKYQLKPRRKRSGP